MARIRTIKPEFFTSDDICRLAPHARLLFIGCWCEADRDGRLEWKPKTLRRKYLPEDDVDGDAIAQELVDQGLIVLYGEGLAVVPTFLKHQVINAHEAKTKLPNPPACIEMHVRADALPEMHVGKGREGKGIEGKGREQKDKIPRQARKTKLPDDWQVTEELLAYAAEQGCGEPKDTAESFRLHHTAKGTLHANWTAAFQYWCRNEKNFRPGSKPWSGARAANAPAETVVDGAGQWTARLRGWAQSKFWKPYDWGPEPGHPRCLVPPHLLPREAA